MKISTCLIFVLFCPLIFTSSIAFAQAVTVHGQVLTLTGVPIVGATVHLVTLNQDRHTDDSGKYDFRIPDVGVRPFAGSGVIPAYSLVSKGKELMLSLARSERVSIELFNVSGRLMRTVIDKSLGPGNHRIDPGISRQADQLQLAKVRVGSAVGYYKINPLQGNLAGLPDEKSLPSASAWMAALAAPLTLAADSIVVTHPHYFGGCDYINTRKILADTGLNNFRMVSSDTAATGDTDPAHGWYCSKMNFVFQTGDAGGDYYKTKVPDYIWEEQETQREIEQAYFRLPSEVPTNKRYATYNCDLTPGSGVASTGGNSLNFNSGYINNNSWWEILGVQHHEMSHSYQQYYSTTGASGFGEAIPDAIRCLTGFFYWKSGSKCSGGFAGAYQTGGRYWYFIELKHPGFIYKVMSGATSGDISTRVQTITGESLTSLCTECEQTGMPYTLGRGSF